MHTRSAAACLHACVQANGWKIITTINLSIIFFIFGITLDTSELKAAIRGWKVLLLGIVSILVITSLTGFIFLNMDFRPKEFGYGLAIFACSPTSLSSGVTVVIQGYGNHALALLMTVTTNILGIFIMPIFVKILLSSSVKDIQVDAVDLLVKLGVSIIIPLAVGKGLRDFWKPALHFAKKYKLPLYLFNNFQIIMIVWQTLSHSRHELLRQEPYDILFAIMGAIGQHFFFLVLNMLIAWIVPFFGLKMKDAERKAFVIMASQKSLPTAAVIISYLPSGGGGGGAPHGRRLLSSAADPGHEGQDEATGSGGLGDLGLVAIPCIVFYVMQLLIDAFIAQGWASKFEKFEKLYEKYKHELDDLTKEYDHVPALLDPAAAAAMTKAVTSGSAAVEMPAVDAPQATEKSSLLAGVQPSDETSRLLHK